MPWNKTLKRFTGGKRTGRVRRKITATTRRRYVSTTRKPRYHKLKRARSLYRKVMNKDATAPGTISFTHGRLQKMSNKFITAVRAASTNINCQVFRSSGVVSSVIGQCTYWTSHPLGDYNDLTVIQGHVPSANDTQKTLIRNCESLVYLSNASSDAAYVRVYECCTREDLPYNVSYAANPLQYLTDGFSDTSGSNTDPAQNAFQSASFCQKFKILNVRNVQFRAGEQRQFSINHKTPRVINYERYVGSGGSAILIGARGFYRFLLFQVQGGVINDSTFKTNANIDAAKIDIVELRRYYYQWCQDNTSTVYSTGAFQNITTAEEIDEATDAVAVTTQA